MTTVNGTRPARAGEARDRVGTARRRSAIRSWRQGDGEAGAPADGDDRAHALQRLIALGPRDLKRSGPALDAAIKRRLERALRAERQRGKAGSWSYDLKRHVALRRALAEERLRDPTARARKKTPPG